MWLKERKASQVLLAREVKMSKGHKGHWLLESLCMVGITGSWSAGKLEDPESLAAGRLGESGSVGAWS